MVSEVVESMVQLREEDLLQVDSRERENFWLNLAKAKEMGMEMAEVRKDLLEVLEELVALEVMAGLGLIIILHGMVLEEVVEEMVGPAQITMQPGMVPQVVEEEETEMEVEMVMGEEVKVAQLVE